MLSLRQLQLTQGFKRLKTAMQQEECTERCG